MVMQRGEFSAVAGPGASKGGFPLPQLSLVVADLRVWPERRAAFAEAGGLVALDSKRWLLPPGVYRITGGLIIEPMTDITEEQLRELIVPALPSRAPRTPEEEAQIALAQERAKHLAEAYRARLGEGPEELERSLVAWVREHGEDAVRQAIIATAVAVTPNKLDTPTERYEWLREVLRIRRRGKKPAP